MIKIYKIILSFLFSFFLMTQLSFSEMKLGNAGSISATVAAASGKYSKGILSNRNQPTASLGLEYNSPFGVYFATSIANDANDKGTTPDYSYEWCKTPGYKTKVDKVSVDLSYEDCKLESTTTTGTYQAKLNFEANKNTNVFLNYYQDSTEGARRNVGNGTMAKWTYEAGLSYDFGPFVTTASYLETEKQLTVMSLGLSKEVLGINFSGTYYSVNSNNDTNYVSLANQRTIDHDHFIISASKTF
jgi:hypothetical protein